MTHNGLKIAGYTDQPDTKISLVNSNKEAEERLLRVIDQLAEDPDVDKRMLAIGKTNLEIGFMALNRSIFRPKRLRFPTDIDGPTVDG